MKHECIACMFDLDEYKTTRNSGVSIHIDTSQSHIVFLCVVCEYSIPIFFLNSNQKKNKREGERIFVG